MQGSLPCVSSRYVSLLGRFRDFGSFAEQEACDVSIHANSDDPDENQVLTKICSEASAHNY